MMKISYWNGLRSYAMPEIICDVCPHHCHLREGQAGFCRARKNISGKNTCISYGRLTSAAIDPIEKKPLARFFPGSYILSVGSFGCNLACPFCQNHDISMHGEETDTLYISPQELTELALRHPESIGAAFTYNEPLISWEYVLDTSKLLKQHGLKTVLVTNGCIEEHILQKLLPFTDAMNIDLKGDRTFCRELACDYDTVKNTIRTASQTCHVEVTILLVPGKNDNEEFIRTEASWLKELGTVPVLHLSRYFPAFRYTAPPTDVNVMKHLRDTALEYLDDVRLGNVWE